MYVTGLVLFGCSCAVFGLLVSEYPPVSLVGIAIILILVVWHPYYYALSEKRRVVLRYAM